MGKRYPAVSGVFYESSERKLLNQIEWCFKHPLGPGKLPYFDKRGERKYLLFICPHAGYIYSGPVASHCYYRMAEEAEPETVIIIGPNHTGLGSQVSIYPEGEWLTPLGSVKVNKEITREIIELAEIVTPDEQAHLYEHSIEVQLPFLQYILKEFKIVAISILMQTHEVSQRLAEAIYEVIKRNNKIIVIASSDMNHYEPHEVTIKRDDKAIKAIMELDSRKVYNLALNEVTMCGFAPIMTVIELAKKLDLKPELFSHATSGDTSGDKKSVVGYLAMGFHI